MDNNEEVKQVETRTTYIQLRVSLIEKAIIEAKAAKAGMKVSEYIRFTAMTYQAKEGEE